MADTDREVDPETLTLAERLRQAVGVFVRVVRRDADTPTTAQSETLGILDRSGPMSVAALAEWRRVKHQSMRLVVAQLEAALLIERHADPADRRSQSVAITGAGRASLARSRAERAARIGALILDRLSTTDRGRLPEAVAMLERLGGPAAR